MKPVFVTGNPEKAHNFSKHMGMKIAHQSIELDEIQTLDTHELVEHKVRQAYAKLQVPVLVEDVTFVCMAWDGLPGPFIKYYVQAKNGMENMCRMLDGFEDRSAIASCTYGYFDGKEVIFFEGSLKGKIANSPRGSNGYGFDRVFEPDGFNNRTAAELNDEEYDKYYSTIKPFAKIKEFLDNERLA